ncbi:hypothetical protein GCM10010441_08010 [Kitasatospora paracochleata]
MALPDAAVQGEPREAALDEAHVRFLAGSEEVLPPIIVHRSTLKVVDGRRQLRAALARGDSSIRARLFDGTEDEAFIHAVKANNANGLALTASDQAAAAIRLLRARPEWSDRAIAATAGVSAQTVGKLRRSTVRSNGGMARAPGLHASLGTLGGWSSRAGPKEQDLASGAHAGSVAWVAGCR